jgi:hypothetical protein
MRFLDQGSSGPDGLRTVVLELLCGLDHGRVSANVVGGVDALRCEERKAGNVDSGHDGASFRYGWMSETATVALCSVESKH